jgi:hypothetical protein
VKGLDAVAVSGALLRYCTWAPHEHKLDSKRKKKKPSLLTRPAETDRDPLRRRRCCPGSPLPPLLPQRTASARRRAAAAPLCRGCCC